MQFQVPQFLEVEDKLFGFMTLKQFLFVIGGVAIAYIAYTYLPIIFAVPIIAFFIPFSLALAFVKINMKPFIFFVGSVIQFLLSPRLYIWEKVQKPQKSAEKKKAEENQKKAVAYVPPLSENKLRDMAWSLDIKERAK